MKGRKRIQWYSVFLLVFCLTSCQVKRPEGVLPDAKMEDVLYDYHIAKAMGDEVPYNESYKRLLYVESVFKKQGITQAVFDSSMVWYARNPEILTKIYEKVNFRLKAERDGINHLIAIRDNKPKESLSGDSVDVWTWQHIYQLTGMPLDNKIIFSLPSDTNFHDRDTLRWNVRFHFRDGMLPDSAHAPLMAMQIQYENDSIINDILKVKKTGIKTITLTADTLGKIKEIRGFIYYPVQKVSRPVLIDHISLMRYHASDSIPTVKDSLQQTNSNVGKDSIGHPDEVRSARSPQDANHRNIRPRPVRESKPIIRKE
ncbi:DUF4296 domain-containing protein [Bacteroides helcogenes]|uniref:DUF4296 domain-containing protein n=1 Tax=Bacteroides helcogenes (strain ATCC 35417 / DSM 20613 / JCM 6297 / CCUG 15421 / P 36-108) TaxID=693979 RepID=E6SU41_BACT6|nr:DUF4296 domain-containing protein [Bacteroides helcogenes]ADV44314.1 hypothetical protein Bache_2346 [Bacteroides helcogenes P 36-108]MDY5238276.1 DUF4296 domain-containing protein [Bacteroides helcogenes]